jgi:sugar phosphate isomerase/epimerase
MKIGIFTVLFGDRPFEEVLDFVAEAGCQAVEIGCGGYPGTAHCDARKMLKSQTAQKAFLKAVASRGLVISALSVHGNPLHPQTKLAKQFHDDWREAVQLAAALKVERVIAFSGCPGDSDRAKFPNWVTCAWPPDYPEILKWQWEQKLIPYWKQEAAFAKKHGIKKICFEMHPGFSVHNPEALLRLRDAVGDSIGANFDPSHLFWQGIDPVAAIRYLGNAIYHFHAKDVKIDPYNTARNGVLDTKPYTDEANRSWVFRTIGWGHDALAWKDMVSALRLVGYDWALSIEHEDSLMSFGEGFRRAVAFLKDCTIQEPPPKVFWA